MKKSMLVAVILFTAVCSHAQFTYKIKADSVKITNDSCDAELILENHTKDILGFLYNRGKGRTEFRKVMLYVDDTTYVIGGDTLHIPKSSLGTVALSAITAATADNTINSGNYLQEWQWNSLTGGSAFKLSASCTTAASNTQKLLEASLSGANANSTQTTYAGYFSNAHTGTTSTNVGIYAKASGGTSNLAGYLINDGGNSVLRIEQQNSSSMAGINFIGGSNGWGVGHSYSSGTFQFNNSPAFSGNPVLQLFPANRVRVGGGSDDGVNAFQVIGSTKFNGDVVFANSSATPGLTISGGNPTYITSNFAIQMRSSTGPILLFSGNDLIYNVNDGVTTARFIVAGDGSNHLLSVLSSTNTVGINVTSPTRTMEVHSKYHDVFANSVFYIQKLVARGYGNFDTVRVGFGAGQEYAIQNLAGTYVVNGTTEFISTNVTNASEGADFVVRAINAGTLAEKFRITGGGKPVFQATNTAGGTTGNQTINKTTGTVNIAASGTTVTVINNLVTTSSIVFAVIRTNDATAQVKNVVPGSGTFTINLSAAATAETSVGFMVVN